jgi:signal transduction histidine kinase
LPGAGRRVAKNADGRTIEEVQAMGELARVHEGFRAIANAVEAMDAEYARSVRASRDRGLEALAGDLQTGSYQISGSDAVRIAANLLGADRDGTTLRQFRLKDDLVLHEPAIVSLFIVPGSHWKIIVVTPTSQATQMASTIAREITLWMVFLVLAVCGAGAVVSYRLLIRPLGALMNEVKALESSDDETARIRMTGRDELGRIAYWFNARTTRLAHAFNHLRRKNQALERATRAAEEASRSKNVFLASMSHEIRTPMNAIIACRILKETRLTPEQADFANTIQTSADSLLSLINDIMDFSKIEAGKLDMEAIDFDVRAVLEEVCDLIAFQTGEKGLDLVCHFNPRAISTVRGDPGRLRQILLNLAGNAVKFTTSGQVAIHGDCALQPDGRPRLRFEVRDSGIGIPREAVDRLFKPFSQVDDSTTRRFGGTGLGLAVCKRLAR